MSQSFRSRTTVPASVLILLLALGAAHTAARSWDLWWHLETGEQIAASGAIPRVDDFTFTSRGTPWIDHEWLFQLLMHAAWTSLGPAGLALLKVIAASGAAFAGWAALLRAGVRPGLALFSAALCVLGFRFRLTERPELATLALAPVVAGLLVSLAGRPAKPAARLLALAATTIVWANMHAGALLAPALAAACLAGAAASTPKTEASRRIAAIAATGMALAAAALALLVNPYGPRIYSVPFSIAGALAPENLFNPEWLAPTPFTFPFLYVTLAAVVVLVVPVLRSGEPGSLARLAMLVVAAALALWSVRHVGVFFALLPVVLPVAPLRDAGRRIPPAAGGVFCILVAAFMYLVPPGGARSGFGVAVGRFPEKAADFVERHLQDARLYNDVRFGGYLIHRGYPARRVFLDGRNEIHADLLAEISTALDDGRRWEDLLSRHQVEGAVVAYRDERVRLQDGSAGTFSETHFPARRWALVHWDDVAMVFVRRDSRFSGVADASGSRARPEAFRLGLLEPEQMSSDEALREEILRKLADDPESALAKSMASVYGIGESIPAPERGR